MILAIHSCTQKITDGASAIPQALSSLCKRVKNVASTIFTAFSNVYIWIAQRCGFAASSTQTKASAIVASPFIFYKNLIDRKFPSSTVEERLELCNIFNRVHQEAYDRMMHCFAEQIASHVAYYVADSHVCSHIECFATFMEERGFSIEKAKEYRDSANAENS